MYKLNKSGPKVEPYGTPHCKFCNFEDIPFTVVKWFLLRRKLFIRPLQFHGFHSIYYDPRYRKLWQDLRILHKLFA